MNKLPKDNNTHITRAVAVTDDKTSGTPRIAAKGEGALAERILDYAFAEGIKVRQDKDLTEILSALDIESPVPIEALHAVSLILERVYAENERLQRQTEREDFDK